jgi:hypothetical protein
MTPRLSAGSFPGSTGVGHTNMFSQGGPDLHLSYRFVESYTPIVTLESPILFLRLRKHQV